MKIMVGYNDSPVAQRALSLACTAANKEKNALVYVVTSLEADPEKSMSDIATMEKKLQAVKEHLTEEKVACETSLLITGLSPGENLLNFANNIGVDHIFLGIEKKSRTSKYLLGSTAQFLILKGPCPVTTTK